MISHEGGVYRGSDTRPAWRTILMKWVIVAYNKEHGTLYDYRTVNLKKLKLDRAHRVSFKLIQEWVITYLQGTIKKQKFRNYTEHLIAPAVMKNSFPDTGAITTAREKLIVLVEQGASPLTIVVSANALLGLLNSSTYNLDLGDASLNRSIQDHYDPNFRWLPTGVSATPRTRRQLTGLSPGGAGGIRYSPWGTRVVSSRYGPVPKTDFTPNTDKLIKKHS